MSLVPAEEIAARALGPASATAIVLSPAEDKTEIATSAEFLMLKSCYIFTSMPISQRGFIGEI